MYLILKCKIIGFKILAAHLSSLRKLFEKV